MQEIQLAAALSQKTGRYNVKLFQLTNEFGSLNALYRLWRTSKPLHQELRAQLSTAWDNVTLHNVQRDIEKHSLECIIYTDPRYPQGLLPLPDRPYQLYVQGNSKLLQSTQSLSSVGTRRMSTYGKRVVQMLLDPLKYYPDCVIVSGLAFGIDAESHRTALKNNLKTVAVLAGGLDRYEPVSHDELARSILNCGGCILSEYPPGVRPQKHYFLERNRIIAGLSQATLVIEGTNKSGSLVTGKFALGYGKDVGAVPGDVFLPQSAGPLQLIRDGAWPIIDFEDLRAMMRLPALKLEEKSADIHPILHVLKVRSATAEFVAEELNQDISYVMQELTVLQLDGLINCTSSGEWYLASH